MERPVASVRVLVVEDEPKVANALREGLEGDGYEVVVEGTGEGAFFRVATEVFDVVLLDLTLPGRDGLEILKSLRDSGSTVPVLILTARDTPGERVVGLDGGADDYLVKPFAFSELLARIRALLRRVRVPDAPRLTVGDLDVDLVTRKAIRGGRPIDLTTREFELLHYLMRHEGHVVPRDLLASDVWQDTARSSTLDNVIDVHIARLRRKLDVDRPVRLIHTIRGIGFMLREGEP